MYFTAFAGRFATNGAGATVGVAVVPEALNTDSSRATADTRTECRRAVSPSRRLPARRADAFSSGR